MCEYKGKIEDELWPREDTKMLAVRLTKRQSFAQGSVRKVGPTFQEREFGKKPVSKLTRSKLFTV
jgi:hypothetical protein